MPYKNPVKGMGFLSYTLVVPFQTNLASAEDKDMLDHGSVGDQDNHLNCIYAERDQFWILSRRVFSGTKMKKESASSMSNSTRK